MKLSLLPFIGLVCFAMVSAAACYQVEDDSIDNLDRLQEIPLQLGVFSSVVWFTDDILILTYRHVDGNSFETRGEEGDSWAVIYDIDDGSITEIEKPIDYDEETCRVPSIIQVGKWTDTQIGFIQRCFAGSSVMLNWERLYTFDVENHAVDLIYIFPSNFYSSNFIYVPAAESFIQSTHDAGGLGGKFWLVENNEQMTRMLPEFVRARSPALSQDGSTIVFAGNAQYEREILSFDDIVDKLYHPWDLYQMDTAGGNLQIIYTTVKFADDVNWVPGSYKITFTGELNRREGIWELDLSNNEIRRIWPESERYAWSPDGGRMVIIDYVSPDHEVPRLVIIEFP